MFNKYQNKNMTAVIGFNETFDFNFVNKSGD